jgi:hypothetical protein
MKPKKPLKDAMFRPYVCASGHVHIEMIEDGRPTAELVIDIDHWQTMVVDVASGIRDYQKGEHNVAGHC